MDDLYRKKSLYEQKFRNRLNEGDFTEAVKENPHLAMAVEGQLIALGIVVKGGEKIAERLEELEIQTLERIADGVGYVARSPPNIAKGLFGGAFNLAEDILFGSLNAIGPYDKVPSYRQSLREGKPIRRYKRG